MQESPDPGAEKFRLGIFDAEDRRVMVLVFDPVADRLSGSGGMDLQAVIGTAVADFDPSSCADPADDLLARLEGPLGELGLSVRRIPNADITFNARVDLRHAMAVGRSETADGAQPLSVSVEAAIVRSIAEAQNRFAEELAVRIEPMGPTDAVAAVDAARAAGEFNFAPTPRLLNALAAIDVATLSDAEALAFLPVRAQQASRMDRFDIAVPDAEMLLERWDTLPLKLVTGLRHIVAIGHAKDGNIEVALTIWHALAYDTPGIDAAARGQILRTMALSVHQSDPRALSWIEQSSDAYLQAGDRHDAAVNYVHWGDMLEHHDAARAVTMLDAAASLVEEPDLIEDALRAGIHHARASRLAALERRAEALEAILGAVAIRRGLGGQEGELLATLGRAADIASSIGDPRGAAFAAEAAALLEQVPHPRFLLGAKLTQLLEKWDDQLAAEVRAMVEVTDDVPARIAGGVTLIMQDSSLGPENKLAGLEALNGRMIAEGVLEGYLTPIRTGIYGLLHHGGARDRAIPWLEKILSDAPLAQGIADLLLSALELEKAWSKGVIVARREVVLKGEDFRRLRRLAQFALADGQHQEGLVAAYRARALASDPAEQAEADKLIEAGLAEGASLSAAQAKPAVSPVTTSEFEQALASFAHNRSSTGRMDFWRKPSDAKDHKWTSQPERLAQMLLRNWLDAVFGGRVTTLEEVGAGAGRLDLLVQLAGGTEIILELKMLGFGYSSTYAAEGADQILHYMKSRNVGLGYLVVFDARLRNNSSRLIESLDAKGMTVREVFVDVTPRIGKVAKKAK